MAHRCVGVGMGIFGKRAPAPPRREYVAAADVDTIVEVLGALVEDPLDLILRGMVRRGWVALTVRGPNHGAALPWQEGRCRNGMPKMRKKPRG